MHKETPPIFPKIIELFCSFVLALQHMSLLFDKVFKKPSSKYFTFFNTQIFHLVVLVNIKGMVYPTMKLLL